MDSVQTVTYQCPNCNAPLEFDAHSGKFKCFYCDSTFTDKEIEDIFGKRDEKVDLEGAEPELTEDQAIQEEFSGQSALYSCPNCGAGVICDSLTSSTRCHFCHTPVVLSGRLSGEFKPDVLIPFAVTKEQARAKFDDFTRGKFFLPKDFTSEAQINNLSRLYVPYWLKSGLVDARLKAIGKKVRSWTSGNYRYTNTKEYDVQREMELAFIRVPCDGSKRIDDGLMESIEPFNYTGIKPFSMSYLSGCPAEKYDVKKEEAAQRIDQRVREASEAELKKTAVNYSSLESVQINTSYRNAQYVYALLPVWFLNYQYKGKDYSFVINGQTGLTFGQLPVSGLKLGLVSAAICLAVAIVVFLIGGMLFG